MYGAKWVTQMGPLALFLPLEALIWLAVVPTRWVFGMGCGPGQEGRESPYAAQRGHSC
jgi:hypothetical protein